MSASSESEQLVLFGGASRSPARTVGASQSPRVWSYSRRAAFEQCLRSYYYKYYGADARMAQGEVHKERLRFMKGLSNRYMRAGQIAHLVIRTYFQHRQRGEEWPLNRLLDFAREVYRNDREYSRRHRSGDPLPEGPKAPALLLEFHYGFADAESLWEESEKRLVEAITNFATSPKIERFRVGGGHPGALVEQSVYLKDEHFSLRGQVDLSYVSDGRIVVVDWKIGDARGGDESLQLFSYALDTVRRHGCSLDDVDLYRVGLVDDEVLAFTMGGKEMTRARARITQDLERMRALDHYGRNAISDAFTPCGHPKVCAQCPFQELCPKG